MTVDIDDFDDLIGSHLITDEAVRGQVRAFEHHLWRRYLPRKVSDQLDISTWPAHTTRQELFDQARQMDDPAAALALYLRIAGWGATHPRSVWCCARPFADPHRLAENLFDVREELHETGPVGAYRSMLRGGRHHIPDLGPAFFSTWLYFCGYPQIPHGEDPGQLYPLILDARIARSLQFNTIYSLGAYATYLDLAHALAHHLGTTPHAIEHALAAAARES